MAAEPYATEWGPGWVRYGPTGVTRFDLPGSGRPEGPGARAPVEVRRLCAALEAYFGGIGDLPSGRPFAELAPTPFLRRVYRIVVDIPRGETLSYAEVARRAGRPGAARAVGAAMAANPFAPVVPCHRVIGSDGRLHGYGGGLPMKEAMLAMEVR
jgi:methylated-DNA-[protein]-cysteine S-methyltransferase